jgi:hypothetical protein
MKQTLIFFTTIFCICILSYACKTCSEYQCKSTDSNIIGAYCNDGTKSDSVGKGACSRHGGVESWRCKKCE